MKKLLNIILSLLLIGTFAQKSYSESIDKTISSSGINKSAVSISVKDITSGKKVYSLNDTKPSIPASTLKVITLNASIDTLGEDYEFSTKLYKNTNNDLYLQLGADPFFLSNDLNKLFETAKSKKINEPKNVFVDDYILDSIEWGEGWQWDDDLNPLMPKFSSYNIDGNLLGIIISPNGKGTPANIYTSKFYPVTFMNLVTGDLQTDIEILRNNSISPDIITISGTVSKQITKQIPINHPKRYFLLRTEDAIKNAKIEYYGNFSQKKTPNTNIYLVDEINHPLSLAIEKTLKNSNNFIAETVFKVAGAKFVNNTGSLENSQKMLSNYFNKIGLNSEDIKIVDGSGVSKNNLITADFMTEFLLKHKDHEIFIKNLPTAGEGTLTTRMLYFKDNLRAKTGTLSDISAITGFITSASGKTYVFDIMINDSKSKASDKKSLEEYILRDIYTNF